MISHSIRFENNLNEFLFQNTANCHLIYCRSSVPFRCLFWFVVNALRFTALRLTKKLTFCFRNARLMKFPNDSVNARRTRDFSTCWGSLNVKTYLVFVQMVDRVFIKLVFPAWNRVTFQFKNSSMKADRIENLTVSKTIHLLLQLIGFERSLSQILLKIFDFLLLKLNFPSEATHSISGSDILVGMRLIQVPFVEFGTAGMVFGRGMCTGWGGCVRWRKPQPVLGLKENRVRSIQ